MYVFLISTLALHRLWGAPGRVTDLGITWASRAASAGSRHPAAKHAGKWGGAATHAAAPPALKLHSAEMSQTVNLSLLIPFIQCPGFRIPDTNVKGFFLKKNNEFTSSPVFVVKLKKVRINFTTMQILFLPQLVYYTNSCSEIPPANFPGA